MKPVFCHFIGARVKKPGGFKLWVKLWVKLWWLWVSPTAGAIRDPLAARVTQFFPIADAVPIAVLATQRLGPSRRAVQVDPLVKAKA